MITYSQKTCSFEPELDVVYDYHTFTQVGYDARPTKISMCGAEWIDCFHKDMKANPDFSDALTAEWQEKFDDIGLAYDCVMGELDMHKITLDRATKHLIQW